MSPAYDDGRDARGDMSPPHYQPDDPDGEIDIGYREPHSDILYLFAVAIGGGIIGGLIVMGMWRLVGL